MDSDGNGVLVMPVRINQGVTFGSFLVVSIVAGLVISTALAHVRITELERRVKANEPPGFDPAPGL